MVSTVKKSHICYSRLLSVFILVLQQPMRMMGFQQFQRSILRPSPSCSSTPLLASRTLAGRNNKFFFLSSSTTATASSNEPAEATTKEPLLLAEGLFTVDKPLNWTSSDVVSYVRGMLERDARDRGIRTVKVGSRRNKDRIIRVGHGGTLDPLATGVLVVAVGKGTKELQSYLSGSKCYEARGKLGFETTTLDMDGNVTKRADFDHVDEDAIRTSLTKFQGKIKQRPPIFSALKKNGKKLCEEARKGNIVDDAEIELREVKIHSLKLLQADLPEFDIEVECGGGTYIRSLIRDIGYDLNSVATTVALRRTKQGQFGVETALKKEDLSPETIYAQINRLNEERKRV